MKLDQMYDVVNKSKDHITADLSSSSMQVTPAKVSATSLEIPHNVLFYL